MQMPPAELNEDAEALRQEWAFLDSYGLPLEKIRDRSKVFLRQVELEGQPTEAYIKIYANKKHPFQRLLRKGRSEREVHNLLFFRSIGIPTPRIIAWGEDRNALGRIVQEFIITQAEKDTLQLDEFVAQDCPNREDEAQRATRLQIARQLGAWTRAMHDHNFIHEDLKWRNILARSSEQGAELFWIDCPKGRYYKPGRQLERKKIKDCATLDKLARLECSKEERTTFLQAYLGPTATERELRQLCRDIENYRQERFDSKDDRQRENAKKIKQS